MRFARVVLGLLLALVGLLVTVAAAAAAFWLVGPDSTVDTGEQRLTGRGLAVATAPDLLDRHGFTLRVTAQSDRPVFVGIAHDLDVASYLGASAYTRVVRFDPPATFGTQEMKGGQSKLNPPAELDWWVAEASGAGEQTVRWSTHDGAYDVVVMNADGTPGTDARVTVGMELKGLFGTCLIVLGVGLMLLFAGLWLAFAKRRPGAPENTTTPFPVAQYAAPGTQYPAPSVTSAPSPADGGERPQPAPVGSRPADASESSPDTGPSQNSGSDDDSEPGNGTQSGGGSGERPRPVPGIPPQYQVPAYTPPRVPGTVRRVAGVLTGGLVLLTATGCVAMPVRNSAAAPFTRAAVTVADGQAVVKRYNEVNNKANQARDAQLAATIEADPTLAMTRAGYQIGRKTDPAGKDRIKPFSYTDPRIGAPQYGSYPMRFVVSSGVSTSPDSRQLGVWERTTAGDPWTLKYSVYPSATMKLPPMEGLRPPTKADMAELAELPQTAAANLAAYLSGGAGSPTAGRFVPSPGTVDLLTDRAKDKIADIKESYISTVTDTFRPYGEPLTFITATGEALVFLALTEQYLQRIEPGSNAYWTSGSATAFSSHVKYTQTLHQDYLHQVALVIPAKGQGKVRILSLDGQLVGAGGS
ncbi:hypothetical protein Kfla_6827 [Kribbella flavida DSM 17836]|uniref:DUF8094 domain-containing protein n=1 Tax=Kribbella flavida (strain DSM 17836 / JCM 10339 / NBRC 14399) TaxID=479435 RepID=D2Q2C2_KRIFD|nr:hypothetical protein [Kribbella flavida]ADB35818.1 hypothetical protein Kfla_6827 [Kribbella flavida DSM 17836]